MLSHGVTGSVECLVWQSQDKGSLLLDVSSLLTFSPIAAIILCDALESWITTVQTPGAPAVTG